jgi:aspartyl-tRNA(Asn)/glutamyl-tRNA(Gln) amidotransferase subunit A
VSAERAGQLSRRDFVAGAAVLATGAGTVGTMATAGPASASATRTGPATRPGGAPGLPLRGNVPDVPLYDLEVWQAAQLIRSRRISPVDLAKATLARIAAVESRVLAFVNLYPEEEILAAAGQAEREIRQGRYRGPLHGITVGLKDIYFTKGKVTEGNSRLYTGFVPGFDATSVARLKAAGAIIFGKVGTSELATSTASPANNPWDLARTPGGSSSGSAAGVAAAEFMIGMGTCTGGSIRGPAANCGLTGYKPTYGTISTYGIFPLAWSMDHAGALVHSARDAALMVDVCGGEDPLDPLSRKVGGYRIAEEVARNSGRKPLRGIVVGVPHPDDFLSGVPNDEELAAFAEAVDVVRTQGATIRVIRSKAQLPGLTSVSSFYDPIRSVEVGAYQYANLRAQPQNMSQDYRNKVAAGVLAPGHGYAQALRVRRLWRDQFLSMFDDIDVVIHSADNIAGRKAGGDPPLPRPSSGSKTNIWNLSGAPAVAIPTGFSRAEGMPLSMQSAAAPGNDGLALRVADAFQAVTSYHKARPPL